jgi:MYXO-CTERM domain-containing protein
MPCDCADADGDGYHDTVCGGSDCDDDESSVHPGAEDICEDGIDQDCDGLDAPCDEHGDDGGGCGCGVGDHSHGATDGTFWLFLGLAALLAARRRP